MQDQDNHLQQENEELKERLREAEETLEAMRKGNVDAIVVQGPKGEQLYSLVSPEHPYQVFIESMGEVALILSEEGVILYANPAFYEMIGFLPEEVIGNSILNFIQESHKSFFINNVFKKQNKKSELNFVTKDQQLLNMSISVSKGSGNENENLCLLATNISTLKRVQRLIETSEAVTKILSEAPNITLALKSVVEILKSFLGWEVIVLWIWNHEKQVLTCTDIAHVDDIQIDEFIEKTMHVETGKKLMSSRVWSSYRPYWIEDVAEEPSFVRREAAMKNNIHGAFAFPFYEKSHLGGVIELFRSTPFKEEVDDPMFNLITSIGIEIGLYIQRKIAEELNTQFSTVVDYSMSGIYTMDRKGVVKTWNQSSERIYGWSAKEIIGTNIKNIYPVDRLYEFDELWNKLIAGEVIEHFQTQRLKKDGKLIWVDNVWGPLKDPFGEINEVCAIVQDISTQKTLENSLAEFQNKFKTYIEMTEEWIWEVDKKGFFVFSNQAVSKILGYHPEEVLGKNLLYFLSAEDREKLEKQFQFQLSLIPSKGWIHEIMHFVHKNGNTCCLEINATELKDTQEQLIGFRGASRDITEEKNLEKIKNEFISIVSHELRTPLTSIYGALTLLNAKNLNEEEKKELIKTAQRNSERLKNIINDIIDIEKLQLSTLR